MTTAAEQVEEMVERMNDKDERPTIHEAMIEVLRHVGAVPKSGWNPQQSYAFRGLEDVMTALRPAMGEAGVVVIPSVEDAQYQVVEVGKNKTLQRECTMRCRFIFYGPRGDSVEAVTYGEALDSGDKATNKAMSAALKYALVQTFLLGGEDTEEASPVRSETPQKPTGLDVAAKERIDALVSAVAGAGLQAWVKDQGFVWPWSNDVCDAIEAKVEAYLDAAAALVEKDMRPGVPVTDAVETPEKQPVSEEELTAARAVASSLPVAKQMGQLVDWRIEIPTKPADITEALAQAIAERRECATCGHWQTGPHAVNEPSCECPI